MAASSAAITIQEILMPPTGTLTQFYFPDTRFINDPNTLDPLTRPFGADSEKFYAHLLNLLKIKSADLDPTFAGKTRLYFLAKESLYFLVFTVLHGRASTDVMGYLMIVPMCLALQLDGRAIPAELYSYQRIPELMEALRAEYPTEIAQISHRVIARQNPSTSIGKGAFGMVCNPALSNCSTTNQRTIIYPAEKYVTKIMFDPQTYEKTIADGQRIAQLVEDPLYEVIPHSTLRAHDLPLSIRNELNHIRLEKGKTPLTNVHPIFAVRMPHFGESLLDIVHLHPELQETVRSCPFDHVLHQLYTVHRHLGLLAEKKYIHGDIRLQNIMWNSQTCRMRLIDFDWLFPYDQFVTLYKSHFGFYCNPPESFYMLVNPSVPAKEYKQRGKKWVKHNFWEYGAAIRSDPSTPDETSYRAAVSAAINDNHDGLAEKRARMDPSVAEEDAMAAVFSAESLPSFDSFPYALGMLTLLETIYPGALSATLSDQDYAVSLHTLLSPIHSSYSRDQFRLMATTIRRVVTLYRAMSDLRVANRVAAIPSFQQMHALCTEFRQRWTMAPPPPKRRGNAITSSFKLRKTTNARNKRNARNAGTKRNTQNN